MPNYRFPKTLRLLSPLEFDNVFAARLSAGDPFVVMYGAPNKLEYARLGLAVSRKAGSAVTRNRWKRLLREAFRLKQHVLPPFDLVCIPKAADPPLLDQLLNSLPDLAERLNRKSLQRQNEQTESLRGHDEHGGK